MSHQQPPPVEALRDQLNARQGELDAGAAHLKQRWRRRLDRARQSLVDGGVPAEKRCI